MAEDDDLDWEEWDGSGSFLNHCVAGSVAGIAEHTLMYPVDTVKTHMQCVNCPNVTACDKKNNLNRNPNHNPNPSPNHTSIISTIKSIVRSNNPSNPANFLRLWRGVHTMFIGCVPAHALYFSSYEMSKKMFGADQPGHHPVAAAASGAISTFFHDSIMTPLDTVKQRLQLGYYIGLKDCVQSMHKSEGLFSFYRSFPTTLAMNIPYGCVMMASNESLKKAMSPDGEFSLTTSMLAGSGAGAIAAAFTTPLDVVKTRLQTQQLGAISHPSSSPIITNTKSAPSQLQMQMGIHTKDTATICLKEAGMVIPQYSGAIECLKHITKTEGYGGLFRGLSPRLMTHAPAVAISWTTYETIKNWLGS